MLLTGCHETWKCGTSGFIQEKHKCAVLVHETVSPICPSFMAACEEPCKGGNGLLHKCHRSATGHCSLHWQQVGGRQQMQSTPNLLPPWTPHNLLLMQPMPSAFMDVLVVGLCERRFEFLGIPHFLVLGPT